MPFNRLRRCGPDIQWNITQPSKKNDYTNFAATWTGLKEIMLSEICQAENDNFHMVSLIFGT